METDSPKVPNLMPYLPRKLNTLKPPKNGAKRKSNSSALMCSWGKKEFDPETGTPIKNNTVLHGASNFNQQELNISLLDSQNPKLQKENSAEDPGPLGSETNDRFSGQDRLSSDQDKNS